MLPILEYKVSYQRDTWSPISKTMTIKEVLNEIANETHKNRIEKIRMLVAEGDVESSKAEKWRLPAVTFCGTFNENRRKTDLNRYNKLIVIDIDKLSSEELERIYKVLKDEECVVSYWISPSSNGIKGLVPLKYEIELDDEHHAHICAFNKLEEYLNDRHNITIDNSGSDITRMCYMSYDPQLVIKNIFSEFIITREDISTYSQKKGSNKKETLKGKNIELSKNNLYHSQKGKNINFQRMEMKNIINFFSRRKLPITGNYEDRYRVAYAISNSFTYDLGRKYFLDLCKIETDKFNETKETRLLQYCYENNVGWTKFNFIEELAKKNGYNKKKLGRGSTAMEANQ